MTFGSLFAGIGGFDLGFERAGLRCVWQVEIDERCRRTLERHWPSVPRWHDVRSFFSPGYGTSCYEHPDVIAAGFPCQDISDAGRRAGIEGERSGLWSEVVRLVRVLRPRYLVVENVAALLRRGMGTVLADLAACGYDAEWDCLPASAFGAPHLRDRVFIVAYPQGVETRSPFAFDRSREAVAGRTDKASSLRRRLGLHGKHHWSSEPGIRRVVDGISANVERVAMCGNSVSPVIAEWIGRRIMETSQ